MGREIMKKVFDMNKMKRVKKGRVKKSIEIKIFLDDESVFLEGERLNTLDENAVRRVFKDVILEYQMDNGFFEDNEKNRKYLEFLKINK
jgi:hypothetical protein